MWRWKQQFLRRPFNLKMRSGRFAAHTILLPEGWTPEQGTLLPIGDVRHLVLARRLSRGSTGATNSGPRAPFWAPLLELGAWVTQTGPHPIMIGGSAGLRAQYDMALQPRRGYAPGFVLPRAKAELLEAALDMEETLIGAVTGRERFFGPPALPNYYAAFAKGTDGPTGFETVEETRAAVQLTMEVLSGTGFLPEGLTSPGGAVIEVTEEEGWRIVSFATDDASGRKVVHRFFPPSALLEHFVVPGSVIEIGTRIGHYATPRRYPSWRSVKDDVLRDAAHDVLRDVVRSLDIEAGGYVLRDVRLCPGAVRARQYAAVYEDVRELLGKDGTPLIHAAPYDAVFAEFIQNGAVFRANVWGQSLGTSDVIPVAASA
jgi:hypothetical protein